MRALSLQVVVVFVGKARSSRRRMQLAYAATLLVALSAPWTEPWWQLLLGLAAVLMGYSVVLLLEYRRRSFDVEERARADLNSGERISIAGSERRAVMGTSRLREDCDAGVIEGCQGGWNNFLRLGLSFDTRDYESDPNRGVFIDAALDVGTTVLGSEYDWVRFMLTPRAYVSPFPELTDLVLAARGTLQVQSRSTPFFAMNLIPFTEEPRPGLGRSAHAARLQAGSLCVPCHDPRQRGAALDLPALPRR